jgi:hypothetical protein
LGRLLAPPAAGLATPSALAASHFTLLALLLAPRGASDSASTLDYRQRGPESQSGVVTALEAVASGLFATTGGTVRLGLMDSIRGSLLVGSSAMLPFSTYYIMNLLAITLAELDVMSTRCYSRPLLQDPEREASAEPKKLRTFNILGSLVQSIFAVAPAVTVSSVMNFGSWRLATWLVLPR